MNTELQLIIDLLPSLFILCIGVVAACAIDAVIKELAK